MIVGWGINDTVGGYWIVKNSWGPDFGDDGYFMIKWGDCSIGMDAIEFAVCGDGYCEPGEDSQNCEEDCYCGDYYCDAAENPENCPNDCTDTGYCGDGDCDTNSENIDTCFDDCCATFRQPCDNNTECCSGRCIGIPGRKICR